MSKETPIDEPIGKFILDNLPFEKRFQTETGMYIHYSDVCTLLKKLKHEESERHERDVEDAYDAGEGDGQHIEDFRNRQYYNAKHYYEQTHGKPQADDCGENKEG